MFTKLGLQVFTLRNYFVDEEMADLTFKKMAEAGYTEAHTAGRYGMSPETFNGLMKKHGIQIIGSHNSFDLIKNHAEEVMENHRLYGTRNIGIGSMPAEARVSADACREFIREFNKTAEIYAKNGFKLTYHNHNFEFLRIDGMKTIMDLLYEGFDPDTTSFVLDTCWVMAGCADVREWMEKLAGRIDILHLKDVNLTEADGRKFGTMTEVGHGNVYWKGVLDTAEQIGVKHYIVEQDNNFMDNNPFKSIRYSADYLKQYMK